MKYYLKADRQKDYQEVTKAQWIKAERVAGFEPKGINPYTEYTKYMTTCATGGFSGHGISGSIR